MKRNHFDLSHNIDLTMKMGQLVPCMIEETLPGDKFQGQTAALVRALPLNAPVLTPTRIFTHTFYVPNRLIWDDWYDFITGGKDGTSAPVHPYMTSPVGGYATKSLADYMGVPPGVAGVKHSALPFRAYALIYNEFFRDQDLEDELTISTASGEDTTTNMELQNVAWEKDEYTLARPWPQRGPQAYLPIANEAPVMGIGKVNGTFDNTNQSVRLSDGTTDTFNIAQRLDAGSNTAFAIKGTASTNGYPEIFADLSEASAVSIRDLRITSAFQRYMEVMSMYGARPAEYLRAMFGVKSPDARLMRPEYIAGGIDTLQWSEVLQTAPSTDAPVGALKGHGIAAMRSNRFRYYFVEHGIVITLMSVKPKTLYTQGLSTMYLRETKEDYFTPMFQHVGMEEIKNAEVFVDGTSADSNTFGYRPRYNSYRSARSRVAGDLRDLLDYWHLGRVFESRPALNADFVKANPSSRIFADLEGDQMIVTCYNKISALRPVAKRADYRLL